MHAVTMLFVRDVEATSAWYQSVLGVVSGHGGAEFDMLLAGDNVIMQLHKIDDDHHDHSVNLKDPLGHGVVVVVYVENAQAAVDQAKAQGAEIISDLGWNEIGHMHEFTMRDLNGYSVMVCEAEWAK